MVTFALPEHQSVMPFVLSMLLDSASLARTSLDGQHLLTVPLTRDDVEILRELGVLSGACDMARIDEAIDSAEVSTRASLREEFERELAELQRRAEVSLNNARLACDGACLE
jgi:hypothetical protein